MGRKKYSKQSLAAHSAAKKALLSKKASISTQKGPFYEQFQSAALDAVSSLNSSGITEHNKLDLMKLAEALGSEDFNSDNYRLRIDREQVKRLHAIRYLLEEAASNVENKLKYSKEHYYEVIEEGPLIIVELADKGLTSENVDAVAAMLQLNTPGNKYSVFAHTGSKSSGLTDSMEAGGLYQSSSNGKKFKDVID